MMIMNKILVEIQVPSIGTSYDFWIPAHLYLDEVLHSIGKTIEELSNLASYYLKIQCFVINQMVQF